MRTVARVAALAVAAVVGLGGSVATASAAETGPELRVPQQDLDRSLECRGSLDTPGPTPVLLIPGTTLTPREFAWNYVPAFVEAGRPYCTVELPDNAMGDIQYSAEYVVSAVRTMAAAAGRPIGVVGHSQGGMITRWGLKFWPDVRGDVSDLIGLAPPNHGSVVADALCLPGCSPAISQQRVASQFMATLNSDRETYDEVDYTVVTTDLDEVVVPNIQSPVIPDAALPASSALDGGDNVTNVSLQSICPGHVADHLTIGTNDAVAYALVTDALDHTGPADPARVDRATCLQPFQPRVDPLTFATGFADVTATVATEIATSPRVLAEPELRDYARASA